MINCNRKYLKKNPDFVIIAAAKVGGIYATKILVELT